MITITHQPQNTYGLNNWTVQFEVKTEVNTGTTPTYKWQYKRPDVSKWFDTTMTGYNTPILQVEVTTARHEYQYRCCITQDGQEIITESATLYVISPTAYYKLGESWKKGILYIKTKNGWKAAIQTYERKE